MSPCISNLSPMHHPYWRYIPYKKKSIFHCVYSRYWILQKCSKYAVNEILPSRYRFREKLKIWCKIYPNHRHSPLPIPCQPFNHCTFLFQTEVFALAVGGNEKRVRTTASPTLPNLIILNQTTKPLNEKNLAFYLMKIYARTVNDKII